MVLTKYCRIFLVVLDIVVGHNKRVDAYIVVHLIFPYLKHPLYSTTMPFDSPAHMF